MGIINPAKHFKIPVKSNTISRHSSNNSKLICAYRQVITKRTSLISPDPLLRNTNTIITRIAALRTERSRSKSGQIYQQLLSHKIRMQAASSHHISPRRYTRLNKDSILLRTEVFWISSRKYQTLKQEQSLSLSLSFGLIFLVALLVHAFHFRESTFYCISLFVLHT